jgi:hypothetical protein
MMRAIHARSDDSRFVDDVAQCGGKNCPPFRSCKDKMYDFVSSIDVCAAPAYFLKNINVYYFKFKISWFKKINNYFFRFQS